MLICLGVLTFVAVAFAVCSKCRIHGVPTNDGHNKKGCKRFPAGHECEICMPPISASFSKNSKRKKSEAASNKPKKRKGGNKKGPPIGDKTYGIRSFHITVTKSGRDTPVSFFYIGCDMLRNFTVPGLQSSCCEELGKEERHRHVHFAMPLRTAPSRRGLEMVRSEVKRRFPNEDNRNNVNVKEMTGTHRISSLVGYHMKTYGHTPLRLFTFNFTQSELLDAYNRYFFCVSAPGISGSTIFFLDVPFHASVNGTTINDVFVCLCRTMALTSSTFDNATLLNKSNLFKMADNFYQRWLRPLALSLAQVPRTLEGRYFK